MKYDVFISYSRKDKEIADRICHAFDKVGINYFIDLSIGGALEFPTVLANAIVESRIFLYLASKNSYDSKFTQSEITFAFNEKPKESLFPYIIDGSTMPLALRLVFSSINWRRLDEHPIDTVLIDDLLHLLGKKRSESSEKNSHADAEKCFRLGKEAFNKEKYEEAVKWFRKAAEQGNSQAQYHLGWCYEYGFGVSKDEVQAVKWYHKAAEQEDADVIELIKLSSEVLVHADAEICFRLGEEAVNKEKYEEAVKWYRKAAEQGDADAQCNLGWCYEHGRGISKDEVQAVKWYRKAAEQGNSQAQCYLGWCYQYGSGISKDEVQAVKWYRKAAEQGNSQAQCNLGWCYEYGSGVSKDEVEAVKWYRKAAEQGHADAIEVLKK